MISTLNILNKEKRLVDEINRWDRCIEIARSQLEDIKKYTIDCETRTRDLTVLESMIKEYQENKSELLKQLDEVRIELQNHLTLISSL